MAYVEKCKKYILVVKKTSKAASAMVGTRKKIIQPDILVFVEAQGKNM